MLFYGLCLSGLRFLVCQYVTVHQWLDFINKWSEKHSHFSSDIRAPTLINHHESYSYSNDLSFSSYFFPPSLGIDVPLQIDLVGSALAVSAKRLRISNFFWGKWCSACSCTSHLATMTMRPVILFQRYLDSRKWKHHRHYRDPFI